MRKLVFWLFLAMLFTIPLNLAVAGIINFDDYPYLGQYDNGTIGYSDITPGFVPYWAENDYKNLYWTDTQLITTGGDSTAHNLQGSHNILIGNQNPIGAPYFSEDHPYQGEFSKFNLESITFLATSFSGNDAGSIRVDLWYDFDDLLSFQQSDYHQVFDLSDTNLMFTPDNSELWENLEAIRITGMDDAGDSSGVNKFIIGEMNISRVPLPSTLILFGTSILGIFGFRRKKLS